MSDELLITVLPKQTQVAYLQQGRLQELHIEQATKQGLVGNIYKGRVRRVMPGMQAAFVDIGLEKAAFLHASDIALRPLSAARESLPDITQLVYSGQDILVQVMKEPLGNKGARLTTTISLALRYLVFTPKSPVLAVSQRIRQEQEKKRLQAILQPYCEENSGFIIRTAAEGADAGELVKEAQFLKSTWQALYKKAQTAVTKCLLYSELALPQRLLRDFVATDFQRIYVDSVEVFQQLQHFSQEYRPELQQVLFLYSEHPPLFDLYRINQEIEQALQREVPLPSGGYLVFDQTEAMTTIDVNTGAFLGKRHLEETIFTINQQAARVIAQQLRLRNLGGIIIIDFIDMQKVTHQQQLVAVLRQALSEDRVRTVIHHFSSLGLIEMTRRRTRESLAELLCQPCPYCLGRGRIKNRMTVCHDILHEVMRLSATTRTFSECQLRVAPAIVEILEQEPQIVEQINTVIGKPIGIKSEPLYTQERFDVIMI